jgi:hypothetical protein
MRLKYPIQPNLIGSDEMEPIWMLFLNADDHDPSLRDLTFYSFIEAFIALKLPRKSLAGVSRSLALH